jgi:integrase
MQEEQDWVMADYILDLRDEEGSLQLARDTTAAAQRMFPGRTFRTAFKVLAGWGRDCPPERAPPMPREWASALTILLIAASQSGVGLALLLAFSGLLRIGEALNLRWHDVVWGSHQVVLLLPRTKTGEFQRVVITSPYAIAFLSRYWSSVSHLPEEKVCNVSYDKVRTWITKGCAALGFRTAFRSHSFRRGAATTLFMAGVPLQNIMILGRWKSEVSARMYIHAGEVALIRLRDSLTAAQLARIDLFNRLGVKVFDLSLA